MNAMIEDLLDLSRIDGGRFTIEPDECASGRDPGGLPCLDEESLNLARRYAELYPAAGDRSTAAGEVTNRPTRSALMSFVADRPRRQGA
jgi:hypothetical protein